MRFKVDENLPVEVAELLRAAGHDAMTVHDQPLSGASDLSIADACRREAQAVITMDTDFANIQTYPPEYHPGIVVLQLRRQDKSYVLQMCARPVPLFKRETLDRHLWIVEDHRVRILVEGGRMPHALRYRNQRWGDPLGPPPGESWTLKDMSNPSKGGSSFLASSGTARDTSPGLSVASRTILPLWWRMTVWLPSAH